MAQYKLQWDNSSVEANSNSIGQRASYRQKSVGGVFVAAGFTPANDLPITADTTTTPVLLNNVVYEFKVQSLCTQNGPTDNDNGVQEGLIFACIAPALNKTATTASITLDVTGTDIIKAIFTLKLSADNSVVGIPVTVAKDVNNIIELTKTGLTESTNYYWQIELIAITVGVEVVSSAPAYLAAPCSPYPVKTDAIPFCNPVVSLDASSIQIL